MIDSIKREENIVKASLLSGKSQASPILKSIVGNFVLALFIIASETSMPITSNPKSNRGRVVRPIPHSCPKF